jgi:hypothetical protein
MGGPVKKLAVAVVAALALASVPALADSAGRAAPVRDGFLKIGGPKRLAAGDVLRVPIRCSVECSTKTKTKLSLPDDEIPPSKANGHLRANQSRNLVFNLNDAATETITNYPNDSKLRVAVAAVSDDSGARVHAVKVFRFTAAP